TPSGPLKFDPEAAKLPNRVPALFRAVTVLPPKFGAQTWPEPSIATNQGELKFDPEGAKLPNRVPASFRAVTLPPFTFVTQTLVQAVDCYAKWLAEVRPGGGKVAQ